MPREISNLSSSEQSSDLALMVRRGTILGSVSSDNMKDSKVQKAVDHWVLMQTSFLISKQHANDFNGERQMSSHYDRWFLEVATDDKRSNPLGNALTVSPSFRKNAAFNSLESGLFPK